MIHVLDWILYFVFLWIIDRMLPDEFKEELGALLGFVIILIYTVAYCLFFYYYNWTDVPELINKHFTL
jgi:hypothetical protein